MGKHKGKLQFRCKCGHKMNTFKANFINELPIKTIWKCSKCKKKYRVNVTISQLISFNNYDN